MVEQSVEVQLPEGLHTRPAAELVKLASSFRSEIWIRKNTLTANAKSIMSLLSLAIEPGATVTIQAQGPDAEEAVASLVQFLQSQSAV